MPKSDLGDVCRRYLPPRLSKPADSSLSNDQQSLKSLLNNESISSEHKRQEISLEELLYTPLNSTSATEKMPANNDVLLTTFNPSTTTNGNGSNGNHSYRTTFVSCSSNSNGNGNHSTSPPSSSSSSSPSSYNDSSSLMMNWELLKDRGSGLVNLGNTCFINASLQCLANTPPLVQWILCNSHNKCCRVKLEKQFCLFCEAESLVKSMHSRTSNSSSSFSSSSAGAADPNNIVRRIRDISTTFKVGRQEDASEFLICLIDKIVDACLRSSQPPERLRPSSGTSYEQLCHSQTIFHDLFGLVLRSRVDCSRCRQTSDTFEVQYAWIVSVRNQHDLRLSLEQFVSREILSGENLYRCMKCKQLVQAAKRYTLHKASKILLINLKRFEFGKNSHKLSHSVRYPEYLDVRPYMSEETVNEQSVVYRLYAVLVHIGSSMHSGHYFSFVRSPNNHWYKADDTTMTQCELNQVLNHSGAYILCYIKETATPTSNGTSTPSKLVYQNGKPMSNSDSTLIRTPTPKSVTMFTPRQVTVQNLPKPINGQNGCAKPVGPILTKPSIVSSTSESTNGNGTLSSVKREPIVMRIPNISHLSMPSVLQKKSIFTSNSVTTSTPSKLVNRSTSTPMIPSSTSTTTKNSNFTISAATSLSSVQSTSSPLKLIIKTSGPSSGLNGLASICNSYNHNDDDDDDDDDDEHEHSSETVEPAKKKARVDDVSISSNTSATAEALPPLASSSSSLSSTSPQPAPLPSTSSSQSNPAADEQQISSSTTKHKKKKKKKKSHKHHHHRHHRHKTHHHRHHHRRSRHNSSRSRSRSLSYSPVGSPAHSNSSSSSSPHRNHRKTKKHHRHKRSRSSTTSRSSRESL